MKATFEQAGHVLQLLIDKHADPQALIDTGLLSDVAEISSIRGANSVYAIDRHQFRKLLQLKRLPDPRPFTVECCLTVNYHDLLRSMERVIDEQQQNFLNIVHEIKKTDCEGQIKALCMPFKILDSQRTREAQGYEPACLRETLAVFASTEKAGLFFCPFFFRHHNQPWVLGFARWPSGVTRIITNPVDVFRNAARQDSYYLHAFGVDQKGQPLKTDDMYYVMVPSAS